MCGKGHEYSNSYARCPQCRKVLKANWDNKNKDRRSGLHVPWNLRVITAIENSRKGNKL